MSLVGDKATAAQRECVGSRTFLGTPSTAKDYSESNTGSGTDARTTLLWIPYVLTDKVNRKVPVIFYNNDFTKRIRIVLEGINETGKMIRIEKIVE